LLITATPIVVIGTGSIFYGKFGVIERVTAAAFGQRRKMLRQSLKRLGPDPSTLLAAAGIDPTARAEEISVPGFVALTRAFSKAIGQDAS